MKSSIELAAELRAYVGTPQPEAAQSASLVHDILESLAMSPPELARHLEIAPQTVNRWRNGLIVPRPRQAQRLEKWLGERHSLAHPPHVSQDLNSLGICLSDEILRLESEAKAVWIVKSGVLREEARGYIGECVVRGLRSGADFHYLFLPHTPAALGFEKLMRWLRDETFSGQVIGYEMNDLYLSRAVGLSEAPGAWIAIEYGASQREKLGRGFDVFFALSVREYADSARTQARNEDGVPCWVELATPQAARWLDATKNLCEELRASKHQKQAHITYFSGVERPSTTPRSKGAKSNRKAE